MLKVKVHSAKVMDYEGVKTLLRRANERFPRLRLCGWTRATEERKRGRTGSRRPWDGAWISSSAQESPLPKRCDERWAREWAREGVALDWQRLLPPKGFQVLPRRWVVERTLSWIDQNRRMSKD